MPLETCPACGSRRIRRYPRSRATQHVNFSCRSCGVVGWPEAHSGEQEVFTIEQLDEAGCMEWHSGKRTGVTNRAWDDTLTRLEQVTAATAGSAGRRLYDVGAGDAGFLAVARGRGWEVAGNDLMESSIAVARKAHGIELALGDLAVLSLPPEHDAVTLWCVLAHVPYPSRLLSDTFDILRPGGVLFLQTPHRCSVDSAALAALSVSRGRVSRWVDRRVAGHHWLLQTVRSMTTMLEAAGFTDIEVRPRARYTLSAEDYLRSLRFGDRSARRLGAAADRVLDREVGPRIVLDAFARRPRG